MNHASPGLPGHPGSLSLLLDTLVLPRPVAHKGRTANRIAALAFRYVPHLTSLCEDTQYACVNERTRGPSWCMPQLISLFKFPPVQAFMHLFIHSLPSFVHPLISFMYSLIHSTYFIFWLPSSSLIFNTGVSGGFAECPVNKCYPSSEKLIK